jgi:DNA invertase Pin-like site-specific DNA recombinase
MHKKSSRKRKREIDQNRIRARLKSRSEPRSAIAALRAEGCDKIFRKKASGKDMRNRPALAKAIDALPTKGVLAVPEWDRATRSIFDGA